MSELPLTVTAHRHPDGWRIVAEGELDMLTAPELSTALAHAEGDCEVDLAGVSFVDVTGLRVLLVAQRHARAAGRRFCVTRPQPAVRRLIELISVNSEVGLAIGETVAPAPEVGRAALS
jgi:anti-sigma B factor antagonist